MLGVVGNNAVHFSVLWATTLKNFRRCLQQRRTIATMRIKILKN
jgi:hypothetical protein